MQQAQAEPSKLISRAGGKNVTTQLTKGDPEIVQEINVAGEAKVIPLFAYADAQTRALFYQALFEITKGDQQNPQMVVLNDTSKVFLDPKYKPQLLTAEPGKMGGTQVAQNVDLKAYRARLLQLKEDYNKRGMKVHQDCVDTLLTALDKQQLLTLAQLQQVYEVLGEDVVVPKAQIQQMLQQMVKQGVITAAEAAEMERKFQEEQYKMPECAKQAPEMAVLPDGRVVSKKKQEEPSRPGTPGYKKWPTTASQQFRAPASNKLLRGQACGPARPPMEHYFLGHEVAISVDLPDPPPQASSSPAPKATSVARKTGSVAPKTGSVAPKTGSVAPQVASKR